MTSHRSLRRAWLVAAACLATLGATASAAGASTVKLATSADPAEDRPMTFTASGTADKSSSVYAVRRPVGGAACAATYSTDIGGDTVFYDRSVAAGSYSVTRQESEDTPGDYLVCAWIGPSSSTADARTSLTVRIRPNAATVTLEVPPTAVPGQPLVITARGSTEIGRSLFSVMKPAGGAGCGSAYSTDAGSSETLFYDRSVQGAYAQQRSITPEAGNYLLCAWIQESSGDLQPEAVTSATLSVQPPDGDGDGVPDATDRCPTRPGPGTGTGCPPRVAPASFSARARSKRDRHRPFKFRFAGSLAAPAGIPPAEACQGQVSVIVKRGRKTISSRRRSVAADCSWSSKVSFRSRGRVGRNGRLKVKVRFLGNDVLTPKSAKSFRVRAG
ncbi:MAG TPA: hypothetical protein VF533_18110 [Solirubrobacteraceae bacterium]|jgi:hypothetical protein